MHCGMHSALSRAKSKWIAWICGMQSLCMPKTQTNFPMCVPWVHDRYSASDFPGEYKVSKILGHRKGPSGSMQLLVRWQGKDNSKDPPVPWEDSYEPVAGVSDDLVRDYMARITAIESKSAQGDVKPLFHLCRASLCAVVAADKTRCEPLSHDIPIDALSLEWLAVAFLEMLSARYRPTACLYRRVRS